MFFKKVAKNTGRNRQAMAPSPTNRSAVFSYHASRSLRTDGTPRSQNKLLLWHGGASKGRPGSVRWLKRLPIMVAFIAFIVVGITSLVVSSEANVLIVKEKS